MEVSDEALDNLIIRMSEAAQDATLPDGYQWGSDAMEGFNFGKNRAYLAARGEFYKWLEEQKRRLLGT